MKHKIVVMGGSFNPPTAAHLALMNAALAQLNAQQGIFVPVGQGYLKRKLRGTDTGRVCFSEQTRMAMLQVFCDENPALSICDGEMTHPLRRTPQTLAILREQYPDSELYFLMGEDKLRLLQLWAGKGDYFDKYHVALFRRGDTDLEKILAQDPQIAPKLDKIALLTAPEAQGISSTRIREAILAQRSGSIREFLHPGVWEMVKDLTEADFPEEIERFQGEFDFLSNDFTAPFCFAGARWQCATAALLAARCPEDAQKKRLVPCGAQKARSIAANFPAREDWEEMRLAVMADILLAKFTQNPQLAHRLINTGNRILTNGGNKKELFWGVDLYSGLGENQLGSLLMALREKFRQAPPPLPPEPEEEPDTVIRRFRREHDFLSNFYPAPVTVEGLTYLSSEAAYQAAKCAVPSDRILFTHMAASDSKRFGRQVEVRQDWETVKLAEMETILLAKFTQNPHLARYLLDTGDAEIREGNGWHDVFWGVDLKTGEGENHLGRLLMALREKFRREGLPQGTAQPFRRAESEDGIVIQLQDITLLPCEAVVNTPNPTLACDGGVDYAILRAAGEDFAAACAEMGALKAAEVRPTEGFGLKVSHIFHTASPCYGAPDGDALLAAAYGNVLDMAAERGVRSIAFPAISAGRCSYPKELAAAIALQAVRDWKQAHPETPMAVTFACLDLPLYDAFCKAL